MINCYNLLPHQITCVVSFCYHSTAPTFAVPFYNPSNHFPRKSCNTSNTKLGFFLPKKNIYTLLDPSAIFWFLFFFVFYRYCSEVTNLKYLQTQENENLMNTFILFAFQFVSLCILLFSQRIDLLPSNLIYGPHQHSLVILCANE